MKNFLVVHQKNLPTRLPVSATLLLILSLDHWNAATWIWVTVMSLVFIRWAIVAVRLSIEKQFDIFPGTLKEVEEERQSFKTRFSKIIEESSR